MVLEPLWQSVASTAVGQYIAGSGWAFPTFESIHVIAIVTVFGAIALMDLRLLGVALPSNRVTDVSHDTLKVVWAAFALALVTGGLLFVSRAPDYMNNPWFNSKMVLILFAGVNMVIFHVFTWPGVGRWDAGSPAPTAAKIAGGLSLAFWVGVIFFGRVIGFTLDKFAVGN